MIDGEREVARMTKQATKLRTSIAALTARLQSPGFASKAPQEVIEEARMNCTMQQEQLDILEKRILELTSSSDEK